LRDFQDRNQMLPVVDAVNHSIIADAVPIAPGQIPGEWFDVSSVTRPDLELVEATIESPLKRCVGALEEPLRVTA
jgi:hypothetical protein